MNASSNTDPAFAALQNDIAALKRDVSNLIEHLKAGATDSAQNAAGQIDDEARTI